MNATADLIIPADPLAAFAELEALALRLAPPHYPTPDAPNGAAELHAWAATHVPGVDPMPVYDGGCDRSIYSSPAGNHAFRAWHDLAHLSLGAGFDAAGELMVAVYHVEIARAHGLSDLACRALWADTWGQFRYGQVHGLDVFVDDQRTFVLDCLAFGIETVVTSGRTY